MNEINAVIEIERRAVGFNEDKNLPQFKKIRYVV